jgi:hypothetical protein
LCGGDIFLKSQIDKLKNFYRQEKKWTIDQVSKIDFTFALKMLTAKTQRIKPVAK